MALTGRESEVLILKELLQSKEAEMLAIYGRRRVGKTFLIHTTYRDHIVFECNGLHDENLQSQLQNFWYALLRVVKPGLLIAPPTSWLQVFEMLRSYLETLKGEKKHVIFLDELPWFDTPRSGFLAALGNFWNAWAVKRTDVLLVICGSAASWMIGKVIFNRGGLHNRVTRKICLLPFTLKEVKDYLRSRKVSLQDYDLLQLYMAIGGIPYYLRFVKPGKSVPQIIQALFFDTHSPLKDEFENLFASLFSNYNHHIDIIQALASKHRGLTRGEILENIGKVSSGAFSGYLSELIESGFVISLQPFLNQKKETIYRLGDEFSHFYLKFLYHKRKSAPWIMISSQQSYKVWCGLVFENICIRHIEQIKHSLGISGIHTEVSSFISTGKEDRYGVQIDLIIDRADNCINLCEMKFHNDVFVITNSYLNELRKKCELFKTYTKTRKNIFLTMITAYGVSKNAQMLNIVSNTVEMKALFQ
ncbi:MAG TPA: ATP-binding protein [Saprospiraceae bacterium]|nr:ATP-binding protein [Saprospiraceae bacterium]